MVCSLGLRFQSHLLQNFPLLAACCSKQQDSFLAVSHSCVCMFMFVCVKLCFCKQSTPSSPTRIGDLSMLQKKVCSSSLPHVVPSKERRSHRKLTAGSETWHILRSTLYLYIDADEGHEQM